MSKENTSRMERRHQNKKAKSHKRGGLWKKGLLGIGTVVLLMALAFSIMVIIMVHNAPTLKASDLQTPQSTRIYDQNDKLVSTLFDEHNRIKVDIDNVPDMAKDAVVSIEDRRFYDHNGLDFRRILGAVKANIQEGWGAEGGSTITQQLVKRTVLSSKKTLRRKVQEAWLALKLERKYSKDSILEMYLNNAYFGDGAYGIKTAAKSYFGEDDLSKLNVSQVALLAGMPNAPSAYNPLKHPEQAKERRDQVLSAMVSNQAISQKQAQKAKDQSISDILRDDEQEEPNDQPYKAFVDTVYDQLVNQKKEVSEKEFYQGGLKIYTTLDSKAQRSVYNILRSDKIPYPDDNFETGISLVDTQTGEVKAVGGGRHFKAVGYHNYGSAIGNSPGSTIKPILDYGPVIDDLQWSTSHTLKDEKYEYSNGKPIGEWDNRYWGNIPMRRALAWSRNIPALKAFQAAGKDKAQTFAKGLGIKIDPIYESASIGSFDEGATPLQMAEAYAAFGNGGTYNQPTAVRRVEFPNGKEWKPESESHKAMKDYTAYMVTDMLKTVVSSGTGTKANIAGLPLAGKTGSTNIPKAKRQKYGIADGINDSWFVGYTPQYSLGVWTGYPSFKKDDDGIQYIQGDSEEAIAKQVFRKLMTDVSDPNVADFEKPSSVVSMNSELYVRGTQPDPKEIEPEHETKQKEEEQSEQEQNEEPSDDKKDDEADKQKKQPSGDEGNDKADKQKQNEQKPNDGNETDKQKKSNDGNDGNKTDKQDKQLSANGNNGSEANKQKKQPSSDKKADEADKQGKKSSDHKKKNPDATEKNAN
ncbi:PBP1A family penicillin-binding protein [Barrientosiimonas marina]|uniref:PBP1A family penicillin-binding protein n=1 Tax=Lentibacillus kimchii TaxID=1542911 RepID=A0ABW2UX35_9BACI